MIRYADDIVFVCKDRHTRGSIYFELDRKLSNSLRDQRKLEIHPSFKPNAKTSIISSLRKDKLKYLGIEFDEAYLSPTKECQERFISRINTVSRLDNNRRKKSQNRYRRIVRPMLVA